MGRAPCCDEKNVKRGPWSSEEDAKLKAYFDKYGTGGNWIALPQKVGLKRCGKSCRLRWLNYLRPNLKHGGFTEEEDNIILNLYISIGSRWSIIASRLSGRTDNDIKNYWNTKLKKKLLGGLKQPKMCGELGNPSAKYVGEDGSSYKPTLSNSALERLQLHMQLQGLQNPTSLIYNNPTLLPNLHPFQEKMIRSLQSSSEKITTNASSIEQLASLNPICYPNQKQEETKGEFCEQKNNFKVEEVGNSFNGSTSSSDGSMAFNPSVEIQKTSAVGANKLNDLMNNGDKELDCFKSVEASKEVMTMMNWWPANLFNIIPWDSSASSPLQPSSDNIFQDYPGGYN